ncbi:MAG TPA: glycosyltransferase [Sediminibacterium sp.]|nr:glycosyltransferase [Sediminibacterium sp.]
MVKLPISAVLCSCQGERFIREQIGSILCQTLPVCELLVVDDASTDGTVAIVRAMMQEDDRIRLICNQTRLGVTANFEKAIREARSEIIAIADQDDIWHPEKLSRLMQSWDGKFPLIYCESIRFKNRPSTSVANRTNNRRIMGKNPRSLSVFNTISGHNMLVKRKFALNAMPFPKHVYYDWWLAMVAMSEGGVQFVPQVLVWQREHDQNCTILRGLTEKELRKKYRQMLLHHLDQFRQIKNWDPDDRNFFEKLYAYWHKSQKNRWNASLFCFLMKHRTAIYAYKKRKIPWISQLKHSWLFAFRFYL